jgi:hypothetical protein
MMIVRHGRFRVDSHMDGCSGSLPVSHLDLSVIQRVSILLLEILAGLVLVVAIGAGVLAWRLKDGPIRLDMMNATVSETLTDAELGLFTEVGATEIAWSGWNRAFELIARDLVIRDTEGETALTVHAIAVAVQGDALLRGELRPKRIEVIDPNMVVRRFVDGHWGLIQSADRGETAEREFDLGRILAPMAGETGGEASTGAGSEDGVLSYLLTMTIRGAGITVEDRISDRVVRLGDVEMSVNRARGGLAFRGTGKTLWSNDDESDFSISGRYEADGGKLALQTSVDRVPSRELAGFDPAMVELQRLDAPITVTADLETSVAVLTGTKETISQTLPTGTVTIALGAGTLDLMDHLPKLVPIGGGEMRLHVHDGGGTIALDGSIDLGGPLVAVDGRLARGGTGWGVLLDAGITDMPLDDLKYYWPAELVNGAQEWVTENLTDGLVNSATIRIQGWFDGTEVETFQVDELDGRIDFENVSTHYFRPLPPVTGSEGWATFNATSMDIQIQSGRLRGLEVNKGSSVFISNIGIEDAEIATVDLLAQGPIADALWVLDHEPLGYAARVGLDPETMQGMAGARVRFVIPLLRDLDVEEIKVGAAATLEGVVVPDIVSGVDLTDGKLDLDLTGAGMKVTGTARMFGRDAQVRMEESFVRGAGVKTRQYVSTVVDADALSQVGLETDGRMQGTAEVEVDREVTWDGMSQISVEANLQDTRLEIAELGWIKPAQSAGVFRAKLALKDGVPQRLLSAGLQAGELAGDAAIDFNEDGSFRASDISRLRFGRTDAAGRVERQPSGAWTVTLSGDVIDLAPLIETEDTPAPDDDPAPVEVRLFADTLFLGADREPISGATLAVRKRGPRIEQLSLKGQLGDGGLSISVEPVNGDRRFAMRADDAGGVLRGFDLFDGIRGGSLRVDGWLTGDGLYDGFDVVAQIEDFRVIDAPAFAEVLSSASFTGLSDTLNDAGIRFTRARSHIMLSPERVRISDAVAFGPGLGLKLTGTIDRETENAELVGLVAPAYSLSRLIDAIPIFGELLTGGEGEGLLATEFVLRGSLQDPTVAINPLTALAPGFLRDIVSVAQNPELLAPSNAPSAGQQQREDLGR